jgi:hypothetical protein
MTREERDELRERSKHDNAIIVGGEVRQLCAEVDRLEAERDAAQRSLAEANEQIAALRAWSSPKALAEAQQQRDTLGGINEQLERSLTEAKSNEATMAAIIDDLKRTRDGWSKETVAAQAREVALREALGPTLDYAATVASACIDGTVAKASAALAAPADDAALREFGLRVAMRMIDAVGETPDASTHAVVDAVLRGSR